MPKIKGSCRSAQNGPLILGRPSRAGYSLNLPVISFRVRATPEF